MTTKESLEKAKWIVDRLDNGNESLREWLKTNAVPEIAQALVSRDQRISKLRAALEFYAEAEERIEKEYDHGGPPQNIARQALSQDSNE